MVTPTDTEFAGVDQQVRRLPQNGGTLISSRRAVPSCRMNCLPLLWCCFGFAKRLTCRANQWHKSTIAKFVKSPPQRNPQRALSLAVHGVEAELKIYIA
jgi:hypothetical protein